MVVKKSSIRTQHERRERERDKKKVVGSGVVLRAQQRCAGIGFVCTKNATRMLVKDTDRQPPSGCKLKSSYSHARWSEKKASAVAVWVKQKKIAL